MITKYPMTMMICLQIEILFKQRLKHKIKIFLKQLKIKKLEI